MMLRGRPGAARPMPLARWFSTGRSERPVRRRRHGPSPARRLRGPPRAWTPTAPQRPTTPGLRPRRAPRWKSRRCLP
eukprot:7961193-Alexandrium_andersonii.AAC.1